MSELTPLDKARCLWHLCLALGSAMVVGGCSPSTPSPQVKMKCVAVHWASHGNQFAILEDERGDRYWAKWNGKLPVVGDTWIVQDDDLVERVREPE